MATILVAQLRSVTNEKTHDMALIAQRLKLLEILEAIGILHNSFIMILNDSFRCEETKSMMGLLFANNLHQIIRVITSELFKRNMDAFFGPFHNCGRNMIHHNFPESNELLK